MKKKYYLPLIALLAAVFAGCVHDHPDGVGDRELTLEWQSEQPGELTDIHLWVFGADGLLKESRTFATLDEAQGVRLTLPAEACTLVAATCPDSHYSLGSVKMGETSLDGLLITLNDASSNPPHIQSGAVGVTADAQTARITPVRVLSELQFTIRNIPSDVVKVRAEVLNCARGFYPGVNRLAKTTETVALGEIVPAGGKAEFPLRRLMPVVSQTAENPAYRTATTAITAVSGSRATQEAEYDTRMAVHMTYSNGETLTFEVSAPPMKNNGSYTASTEYGQLEKDVVLKLTPINGWTESDTVKGNIELK